MFKLNKQDKARRNELIEELNTAAGKLTDAIASFNDVLSEARGSVEEAVDGFNGLVEEAREFAAGIAERADEAINDKSDTWQEGERGQAATEFKDAWEALELDDIEIEFPDELDTTEPEHVANLEAAPEELEG